MNPTVYVVDNILKAFNKDCWILREALSNSLSESFNPNRKVSKNFWRIHWNVFSPRYAMEEVNPDGDDLFNAVCGDLGLGEAQRNSFFLNYDLEVNKYFSTPAYKQVSHASYSDSDTSSTHHDGRHRFPDLFKKGFLNSVFSHSHGHNKRGSEYESAKSDSESEVFPTYADIPYGTSYRQQKKLYEKEMDHLVQHQNTVAFLDKPNDTSQERQSMDRTYQNLTAAELDAKLLHAVDEMEELKVELDACCKRLDAKYQAVAILKKQAENANCELNTSQEKFHERSKKLEKQEGGGAGALGVASVPSWRTLEYEYEHPLEGTLSRVCRENSSLMSKLEARCEELKKTTAHKSALVRERDELLALLDVTERLKYEQGKSLVSDDEYGSFTSSELAVLGACKCRGADPEPCGCAHAAASLRKEVAKLREEIEQTQQRRQEAVLTVDAYRTAFEEQLSKTKILSSRLAEVSTLTSRSVKAKAAMKYLIQVLADDEIDDGHFLKKSTASEINPAPVQKVAPMNLHELLQALTEMVIEKKEILAHQKLASKILANKLSLYENNTKEANQQDSPDSAEKVSAEQVENNHQAPLLGDQGEKTPIETLTEEEQVVGQTEEDVSGEYVDLRVSVNDKSQQTTSKVTGDFAPHEEEHGSNSGPLICSTPTSTPKMAHDPLLPSIHEQGEEDCSRSSGCFNDMSCDNAMTMSGATITTNTYNADQGDQDFPNTDSGLNNSVSDTAFSDLECSNPFENNFDNGDDTLGDSFSNADNGSSYFSSEDVVVPAPKKKSLNPFDSDYEDEEYFPADSDQGHHKANHHSSDVSPTVGSS